MNAKGLTRNVIVLGLISFFSDLSTEMITPVLPLFLVGVLGASYVLVGLIEGSADFLIGMLKFVSGWYSDKIEKRKPFIVLGYLAGAFVKPMISLAQVPLHYMGLRLAERAGKGIRGTPRDALIVDSVDKSVLGRAFGFRSMMDTAGAVAGAVSSLVLVAILVGEPSSVYRTMFVISAVPAFIAGALALFVVKEFKRANVQIGKKSFSAGLKSFNRELKFFIFTIGLFSLGNFTLAFFILRAKSLNIPDNQTVLLFLLFNIVYALAAIPFGELSDRIGRRKVIALGFAMFSAVCLGFAFSTDVVQVAVSFAFYGLFMGVFGGVPQAYVSEIALQEYKATALGVHATVSAALALASSVIGGFLWDSFGASIAFGYGALMGLIALALFGLDSRLAKR
ncbi:MAG: MFS transporter [Thaumarchaeota archaeon]|nr:MFS transporter [Nitrososphaerota archaeon]